MKENKKYFVLSAVLFIAFVVFTVLVKTVDVAAVGPMGSEVGFASINKAVSDAIGYNESIYKISEILGYLAIATVLIFGLFGVMQLYYKKGFKNVDKDLYALCGLYVLGLVVYAVFEKVVINYRPVILEEGLEASYPSSHTILAVAFISAAIVEFNARLKAKKAKIIVLTLCALDGIGVVVTRLLSGVHWLTDIIGSLLISSACFVLFWGVFNIIVQNKKKSDTEK